MATPAKSAVPVVARLGFSSIFFTPDMDFATRLRILGAKAPRDQAAILVNQDDAARVITELASALAGAGLGEKAAALVQRWNNSVDLLEANVALPGQTMSRVQRLPARGAAADTPSGAPATSSGSPFNFS